MARDDNESTMDTVLAAAPDAVVTIDDRGQVVDWNPAAEAMFGVIRAKALGRPVTELAIPQRLRRAHRTGLRRVFDGGASKILGNRVEQTARRSDGHEFPVELTVTRTSADPARFTAWIRDVSERRELDAQLARRKELLECAEQLAQIGSWAWRPATDEVEWTDNMFRIFGLAPGEVQPSHQLALERTHPEDREHVAAVLDAVRRGGTAAPLERRIVRPDGAIRYVRTIEATEQGDAAQRQIVGVTQDVTDERLAQRRIAAHLAVSDVLNRWDSLEAAQGRLLGDLARELEFQVAILWLPQSGSLVARRFWGSPVVEVDEFERASRDLRLPRGIDLPGQAWDRGEVVDLSSVIAGRGFLRDEAAAEAGLRDGLALPVLAGEEVLAVIELFSTAESEVTVELTRSLTAIGYELGAFFTRRRAELKPPPLTPRELEVLQLVAYGLTGQSIADQLVVSASTVKTHLANIYSKLGVSDRASAVAEGLREGLIQ